MAQEQDRYAKKRKFDDVDVQDGEGLSLSSSSSGSCSSGMEEDENVKKRGKFDLEKVEEEEEEEDEEDLEEEVGDDEEEDDLEEEDAEEGSKFTKEEVQKMEVKPEEYAYQPTEEEKKFYESAEYNAYEPTVIKDNADEGSMEYHYHPMSDQEFEIYNEMVEKSEGFDVPLLPGAFIGGRQVPNNLTLEKTATYVAKLSKLALVYYNNKYGTNYVLKSIEKSNAAPTSVLTYYITFEATPSVHSDHTVTFQAKVYVRFTGDIEVLTCRTK